MTLSFLLIGFFCLAPGVHSEATLTQTDSQIHKKPNESFKMTCRGSGFDFSQVGMNWIRQDSGRKLEWLGAIWFDASKTVYAPSVEGRVTITRDNKDSVTFLELKSLVTADSATYFCARWGELSFDIWGNGQYVAVSSVTEQIPSLFPLISCGKSQDSITTVGCLAKDFFPKDINFSWADKSNNSFTNGLKTYDPILQNPGGVYVTSSQVKVTTASWANHDRYYCTAKHGAKSVTIGIGNSEPSISTRKPVVTMHAPVNDDLVANGNGTIVCLTSNFFPGEIKINWLENHERITDNILTDKPTADADGYYTVSSYITVSKTKWDADTVYSCVVEHSASGFSDIRNLSKSQACEAAIQPGSIKVTVVPPSFETIYFKNVAPLTCVISNLQTYDGLEVSWYEVETGKELTVTTQESQHSAKAITTVCPEDWDTKTFECRVKHSDLTSPMKATLAKEKGQLRTPTIIAYPPHQDELNKKETASLTCLVKGFYTKDIFVKWLVDGQVKNESFVTTEPIAESSGKSYMLYSTLTLTSTEGWTSGKAYTCMVGHESLPLRTAQKTIDKNTGKPTSVNVSLVMSDSC